MPTAQQTDTQQWPDVVRSASRAPRYIHPQARPTDWYDRSATGNHGRTMSPAAVTTAAPRRATRSTRRYRYSVRLASCSCLLNMTPELLLQEASQGWGFQELQLA